MKKCIFLLLLLITANTVAQYRSPRQLYPGLFEQVELSGIFPDSKAFPDAVPKESPALIEAEYLKHKSDAGFDLKAFVDQYFTPYTAEGKPYTSDISAGVRKHIDTLWTVLSRRSDVDNHTSLIPLPHPYIVPGGRFREVYYWDSYFTMLGLQVDHKTEMIDNVVENFAYLINTIGFIPNGNRTYYLTRSQPPFFHMMVELLAKDKGNTVLTTYLPSMVKEYQFWMKGSDSLKPGQAINHSVKLTDGTILNRYWDSSDQPREESYREDVGSAKTANQKPADVNRNIRAAAESGWDFSSRWFADGQHLTPIITTDLIPVDLNAILYHMELTIAKAYTIKGNTDSAVIYQHKAQLRAKALQKYCWNAQQGWFMDYNWKLHKQTNILSLAGTVPLFFGIPSQQQAIRIAKLVQTQFLKPGGLITTLAPSPTGQQWDAPNAWAPLQYMTIEGLDNYHQYTLAKTIAKRWISTNTDEFNQTGKLLEKYNVMDTKSKFGGGGEYPLQDGFGWTNGVLLKLMEQYK